MELSPEIYSLIITHVGNRTDICTLAQVSRAFQAAAERALYNTLLMTEPMQTEALCARLASRPRLALLVAALTISPNSEEHSEEHSDSDHDMSEPLPPNYWELIHRALLRTTRLRYLGIHLEASGALDVAWVLRDCTFQLYTFHCDLAWNNDLVTFLGSQLALFDLHISDFNEDTPANDSISALPLQSGHALPRLVTLECTFIEAVALFAPGRPLHRVKTCFSRSEIAEKRAEMALLVSSLRLATASLHSLNVPDSTYSAIFSLDLLSHIVQSFQPGSQLRYVGPFVLPVDGRERLRFYGLLRRLPCLLGTELEVSAWDPAPISYAALRALASELRLYAPTVMAVTFLNDLDQTVMRLVGGIWTEDIDSNPDGLWRDM